MNNYNYAAEYTGENRSTCKLLAYFHNCVKAVISSECV